MTMLLQRIFLWMKRSIQCEFKFCIYEWNLLYLFFNCWEHCWVLVYDVFISFNYVKDAIRWSQGDEHEATCVMVKMDNKTGGGKEDHNADRKENA